MELHERMLGQVVIVDVHGPMVRDEAEPILLLTRLRTLIDQGHRHFLLNVAEVTHVDSLWLGAVVQGYTSAVRRGGILKLVHVSKRFRELLAVTKLERVLEAFDSEEAGAASFGTSVAERRTGS